MNKLKKRLESRNDGQKIQQALDKLTAQHEEEKKVRTFHRFSGVIFVTQAAYAEFHQHKKRHEEQALAKAAEVTRLTRCKSCICSVMLALVHPFLLLAVRLKSVKWLSKPECKNLQMLRLEMLAAVKLTSMR